MAMLKLFRSTGYASVFGPGETRIALHPGWVVLAASLWTGLACNAPLWLALMNRAHPVDATAYALLAGGGCAVLLGLFAWGHFFKPVVILVLLGSAWVTAAVWARGDAAQVINAARPAALLPWQLAFTLPVLALLPWAWLRQVPVKRMSTPRQLRCNLLAILIGAAACAAALWLVSPELLGAA